MGLSSDVMLNMLHHVSVESTMIRAVLHDAFFEHDNGRLKINCLLDSGALNASYVRKSFVDENRELFDKYILPYNGKAKMANEATASIREAVVLPLMLSSAMGQTYCVDVKFLVMDKLYFGILMCLLYFQCITYTKIIRKQRKLQCSQSA